MVSFEKFILSDGPIYQQIVIYIKREISSGSIAEGDEMPSRRVLSALLGVNPNTIQKAYKILEDEGIIESRTGSKSTIVLKGEKSSEIRNALLESDIGEVIKTLKQIGITKKEAFELIDKYWMEGD